MKKRILMLAVSLLLPLAASAEKGKKGHAHGDHTPKHGGQFFMAPDRFHHLEGAMPTSREFRLFFYDDHTKPVAAKPFANVTTVEVDRMDSQGREFGKPVKVEVQTSADGSHLRAPIPSGLTFPLHYSVRVKFPKSNQPELFNFVFVDASKNAKP